VIVVIGSPVASLSGPSTRATGLAARVALAAATAGRPVQLVGRTGTDLIADRVVLDLAHRGVGHVALLRDPARATPLAPDEPDDATGDTSDPVSEPGTIPSPTVDAADVELGLRYLTEFTVVVLAEAARPDVVAVVAEAARWSEARLILLIRGGEPVPDGLPPDVIVFEAPESDPDGAFATLVGAFAAGLDVGSAPADAFQSSIALDGWSAAPAD
jgi:hypothetical protein